MSFNGSGTFVLNVGNYPYVANTLIKSADINALLNDVANGLSNTTTRDGQSTQTGPIHMGNQTIDGVKNLTFGTVPNVISGDMSNATIANRVSIQTSIGNGASNPNLIPNGSGTSAALNVINNSAPLNSAYTSLGVTSAASVLDSNVFGSGTQLPWNFNLAGTTWMSVTTGRNITLGAAGTSQTFPGNVLIGAPSSGTALAINGGSVASTPLTVTTSVTGTMQTWNDGTVNTELLQFSDNNLYFGNTTNHAMQLVTNNIARVGIAAAGNITANAPASGNTITSNNVAGSANYVLRSPGAANFSYIDLGRTGNDANIAIAGAAGNFLGIAAQGDLVIEAATGALAIGTFGSSPIGLVTNNSQRFRVQSGGIVDYNADAAGTYYEVGFRSIPAVTVNGAGSTAAVVGWRGMAAHVGGSSTGVTVNASIFSAGDIFTVTNTLGSSVTLTAGASVTFELAGTATTGNRTIAQKGECNVHCIVGGATPTFRISGAGVS